MVEVYISDLYKYRGQYVVYTRHEDDKTFLQLGKVIKAKKPRKKGTGWVTGEIIVRDLNGKESMINYSFSGTNIGSAWCEVYQKEELALAILRL